MQYRFAGYVLDADQRTLADSAGAPVNVSWLDLVLLLVFLERPQTEVTREQIGAAVWRRAVGPHDNLRAIDTRLARLRARIEPDVKNPTIIKTVRGTGYYLAVRPEVVT